MSEQIPEISALVGQNILLSGISPCTLYCKPGRPCLPFKKRGRKPDTREVTAELSYAAVVRGTAALPVEAAAAPAVNAVAKLKRTNWGKGDNLVKLTKAKDDWLNKTGSLLSKAPDMSMWLYAKRVGIPLTTLHGRK